MTGGFLRPSVSNPPLPRLRPQPVAITRIIGKRREARAKRILKLGALQEMLCDVKREAEFEEGLARMGCAFEPVFAGALKQTWCKSSSLLLYKVPSH